MSQRHTPLHPDDYLKAIYMEAAASGLAATDVLRADGQRCSWDHPAFQARNRVLARLSEKYSRYAIARASGLTVNAIQFAAERARHATQEQRP